MVMVPELEGFTAVTVSSTADIPELGNPAAPATVTVFQVVAGSGPEDPPSPVVVSINGACNATKSPPSPFAADANAGEK